MAGNGQGAGTVGASGTSCPQPFLGATPEMISAALDDLSSHEEDCCVLRAVEAIEVGAIDVGYWGGFAPKTICAHGSLLGRDKGRVESSLERLRELDLLGLAEDSGYKVTALGLAVDHHLR